MLKNIVFTYITPFHPERGGIGRVTNTLTIELQKRGYNIYYLIYDSSITIKHEYSYPAPLTYLPSKELLSDENINFYHDYLIINKINIVINQSGNFEDSKLWVNTGNKNIKVISVLHANPWIAYKHLWSSDIFPLKNNSLTEHFKRIVRVLLYPYIKNKTKITRIHHFKELLPKTDYVCMLSENYFKELSEICPGYESKYYAIPNPNSYSDEQLQNCKIEKKNQILFVGLFSQQKREDRLIKIWKHLYKKYSDWELIILGDGSPSRVKYLKDLASGIPNISFKGFKNPLNYYHEASVFCMTSNYEGWGMVLTEAMQCGTVPIAFNSFAAVQDIIENGKSGILIEPFKLKKYINSLDWLLKNESKRALMSQNAKESIKKFSVENVVDQWENLINMD